MRLITLVIIALLLEVALGEARLPEIGDQVSVTVLGAGFVTHYWGTITDMDDSMITLDYIIAQKTYPPTFGLPEGGYEKPVEYNTTIAEKSPNAYKACIGKGTITELKWIPLNE